MPEPWTAEHVVTAGQARALVEAQFPQLAPAAVEPFGAGWDNTAFLVNGTLVFRFPRRQVAVPLLESEMRVLPVIAPLLPLPVPCPAFAGRPGGDYPWPFAGYPLLPGRTACQAGLTDDERLRCAPVLGNFLAALHSAPLAEAARAAGAGPDPIDRLNPAHAAPKAQELLARLVERGLVEDARPLSHLLQFPADYRPRADTLVHGDLYSRHLLVDGGNNLCGVIDWGDVHLGDPALDLTIALTFLPPAARAAFARACGATDEAAWRVARFRAVRHSLHVLEYAHDTGDGPLLREARRALQNSLAVEKIPTPAATGAEVAFE